MRLCLREIHLRLLRRIIEPRHDLAFLDAHSLLDKDLFDFAGQL